jgi:DNA-binding MarR family transcriptional regulator
MIRALDRAVLEVARDLDLRPMELYALLLLHGSGPIETSRLAEQLSASTSQAKQLALRLCARGIAARRGMYGRTELTEAGRDLARRAEVRLEDTVADRMSVIDPTLRVLGGVTLADLTLPATA